MWMLFTAVVLSAAPGAALSLPCPQVSDGGIKVDGFFNDWKAAQGSDGRAGESMQWEMRAARDSIRLFLVFGAQDDIFVPTPPSCSKRGAAKRSYACPGDHVVLVFGHGQGRRGKEQRLVLLPGDLEDRAPALLDLRDPRRTGSDPGFRIDGATRPGGGWLLELSLPLSWLPAGQGEPGGLSMRVLVWDKDSGPGPSEGIEQDLHLLFPEWQRNMELLLEQMGLPAGTRPGLEESANVGGDGRVEKVMVFDPMLAVLGEGLGEGAYYMVDLPFPKRRRTSSLETLDLTGDQVAEIILRFELRDGVGDEQHVQEFVSIYQYTENAIHQLFVAELSHKGPGGQQVINELRFLRARRGGARPIRIRFKEARGFTIHDYKDVDGGYDNWYEEVLLPWSGRKEVIYRYQDGRFLRDP